MPPSQREQMFKFVLTFSGEIPSRRYYTIATTSINQSVYRYQGRETTGESSRSIDHLPRLKLIQHYQSKKATVLPGRFEAHSLFASKVESTYCDDIIPGKEFVMNISMIVLSSVSIHHLQSRERLAEQVNLCNATYFNKRLPLVLYVKLWQLKRNAYKKILSDI